MIASRMAKDGSGPAVPPSPVRRALKPHGLPLQRGRYAGAADRGRKRSARSHPSPRPACWMNGTEPAPAPADCAGAVTRSRRAWISLSDHEVAPSSTTLARAA
jgi:hypothetical protein